MAIFLSSKPCSRQQEVLQFGCVYFSLECNIRESDFRYWMFGISIALKTCCFLLFQKKPSQGRQNRPMFEPPDIFVTEEFINPPQPVVKVADFKPLASGMDSAEANSEPSGVDKETTNDESSATGNS